MAEFKGSNKRLGGHLLAEADGNVAFWPRRDDCEDRAEYADCSLIRPIMDTRFKGRYPLKKASD